jgi:hypothetical protein
MFAASGTIWKVAGCSPEISAVFVRVQKVQPLDLGFGILKRRHDLLYRDG